MTVRRLFFGIGALLLMLGLVPTLHADKIVLTNGAEILGKIVEETDEKVSIQTPLARFAFTRSRIAKIVRQSDLETHFELGTSYLAQNAIDRAVEQLELAWGQDKANPKIRHALSAAYMEKGRRLQEARRYESARTYGLKASTLESRRDTQALIDATTRQIVLASELVEKIETLLNKEKLPEARSLLYDLFTAFPARGEQMTGVMAGLLTTLGDQYLASKLHGSAADCYREAIDFDPQAAGALERKLVFTRVTHVNESIKAGDSHEALRLLGNLLQVVPESAPVNFYYAVMLEATGTRPFDAAPYYAAVTGKTVHGTVDAEQFARLKKAARTQLGVPDNAKAVAPRVEVERWNAIESSDLKPFETDHFVIHHRNHRLALEVARVGERKYAILSQAWPPRDGKPTKGKIQIYLFKDEAEYSKATGQADWSGGSNQVTFIGNAITARSIYAFQTANGLLDSILPHELAHVLLIESVGGGVPVPRWLSEGVAVMEEPPYKKKYYTGLVRSRVTAGDHIPLHRLFAMTDYPEESAIRLYYAESYSVTAWLIGTYGRDAIVRYCRQLKTDKAKSALLDAFGYREPSDLEAAWKPTVR